MVEGLVILLVGFCCQGVFDDEYDEYQRLVCLNQSITGDPTLKPHFWKGSVGKHLVAFAHGVQSGSAQDRDMDPSSSGSINQRRLL